METIFLLPSNVFDEATLLKHTQHALLGSCPYSAGVLLPLDLSRGFVCILARPSLFGPFPAGKSVLFPYALPTDVLPPLRQVSEHQHCCQWCQQNATSLRK